MEEVFGLLTEADAFITTGWFSFCVELLATQKKLGNNILKKMKAFFKLFLMIFFEQK